jgi:hypothetical protein
MIKRTTLLCILFGAQCVITHPAAAHAAALEVDETPAQVEEWGFRPDAGEAIALNPPRFSWRPQKPAAHYRLEVARDKDFEQVVYRAEELELTVHAPHVALEPGEYWWRFGFARAEGKQSSWSGARAFVIPDDAVQFPIPRRAELLARVPREHPRLFVRPEQMPELRRRTRADLKQPYERVIRYAEALMKREVSTQEPPLYPKGTVLKSEQWREHWRGAWDAAVDALNPAAELGFAYQLSGERRYGKRARELLMEVAKWDPKGASGYLYNDESGMPYAYLFSRTYTFIHDLLTEEQREICREVMRVRGKEMYDHLHPSHFWTPYKSHQNRAWHFLGEVAIAFHGEIEEADDWLWFAANVFANVYPVWNDSDGGWHEGLAYFRSYMTRFTWWADVMHAALALDAYKLPFFSQAGYYPMYLQPPGTVRGGFGDQTQSLESRGNAALMAILARAAQNPYWQWYADVHELPQRTTAGYIDFVRASQPPVEAKPPTDLPTSRVFRGVGQAFLNTTLLDAQENVALLFKSSPRGTASHGYESQNAFELYVFGRPLLLSSGQRDIYGSDHHKDWMWETKSVNSITISGRGQLKHSPLARGRITSFQSSLKLDFVQGDASQAYDPPLRRFTRSIVFAKSQPMPVIVIIDDLETGSAETFEYHLHAPVPMVIDGQQHIRIVEERGALDVSLIAPSDLTLHYTDQFDPPPRERVKLTQYHLTAATTTPATKQRFITILRPHGSALPPMHESWTCEGNTLRGQAGEAPLTITLGDDGPQRIEWEGVMEPLVPSDDNGR